MSRIRIGILGLNFGRHIVDALRTGPANRWVELTRVCDRDPDRAKEVARQHHLNATYELDDLLADSSLDAIGVFTGPVGRAGLIRKCIRAGKHVMTTKPLETDPDAALDVLNEARSVGRIVHLNSPAPRVPANIRQAIAWQRVFDLGRPIACRRDVWASYRETPDGTWQDSLDQCPAAPILRLGIYLVNDMIQLLGEAETVQVTHSRLFTGRPTADNAQMSIQFKSGAIGNIFASFCVDDGRAYGNSMVLNYQRGTIYQNTAPYALNGQGNNWEMSLMTRNAQGDATVHHATPDGQSGGYQWETFSRAVHGESVDGEITPQNIVAGLRVIAAMSRAAVSGRTERVLG